MAVIPPFSASDDDLEQLLARAFVTFDHHDSGCLSFGSTIRGRRVFVKTAHSDQGLASLRSAIRFHEAVQHPAIVRPEGARSSRHNSVLVYPWKAGSVLNQAGSAGSDRAGLARFRRLPVARIEEAIRCILSAHRSVEDAGFVSVDFYDGAMLYDFDRNIMRLVDLDEYRPCPFLVTEDRLPGSLSYMAPEELRPGGRIDARTMVFTMGRTIQHLLSTDGGDWRGTAEQRSLVASATANRRARRPRSVAALSELWRETG